MEKPKLGALLLVLAFVLLLFLPNIGVSLYSNFQIAKVRQEMKTKLKLGAPKELLQTMTFSKSEYKNLDWTKPNKEYKINGNFFDVVLKKIINNEVVVVCISDTNEDVLFVELDQLVKNEASKQGITLKLTQLLFMHSTFEHLQWNCPNFENHLTQYFDFNTRLTLGAIKVPKKPPTA